MSDIEIVEVIANLWVESGRDAALFHWNKEEIVREIQHIIRNNEFEKEINN